MAAVCGMAFPAAAKLFPPDVRTVGLVSISSLLPQDKLVAATNMLVREGYRVKVASNVVRSSVAPADERARLLEDAWLDPEIDILWFTRGGNGAVDVVPLLDWNKLRTRPDMRVVGFSDVTLLLNTMLAKGVGHPCSGHSISSMSYSNAESRKWFTEMLAGEALPPLRTKVLHFVGEGDVSGLPMGGHLERVYRLFGMKLLPSAKGRVVFLECTAKYPPEQIRRCLEELRDGDALAGAAAVVFADFRHKGADRDAIDAFLPVFAQTLSCPVFSDYPYGHCADSRLLDFHRKVCISADGEVTWPLLESAAVTMQNIAHRGMWDKDVPQNTVESIKRAYDAGATWVETDFHHTKAGQMVCIHAEGELKKYTGCKKKIVDLTPEDIATLNLGEKDALPKVYRIPLLDQVLAVVPKHCVLQSEIKGYSPQYADIFDAAVKAAGLSETNIVVSSFHYDALKDFKARYPKYRAVWLVGLSRKKPFNVQEYIAKCKAAGIEVFCPGCQTTRGVMTPADADAVRAAGLEFRFWGVNSLDDLRQAKTLGAVGFTSNYWRDAFDWARELGGVKLLPDAARLLCQNYSHVDSCGTLHIDSSSATQELGWQRYALTADDFVPGERYRVTFKARVEEFGSKAFLFVLVRPKGRSGDDKDLASLKVKPTGGKWQECELKFDGGEALGYRLQFHGWNRFKADISDLKIEKRPPFVFVPARRGGSESRHVGDSAQYPCGAKEFDVDAPRNATGPTIYCADYGVSETNANNTAALRAAFADAKAKGAAKLVLARGRYALNTDSPLILEDFRDFTFDGGGSVFVSYRHGGAFLCLRRSLRTKFMNFSLDWDWSREPLASIVRVKRVDAKSYDLEFVDYTNFPSKNAALTVLSAYDPKTRSVGIEDGITRYLDMGKKQKDWVKRTWLDDRTVRVEDAPKGIAVGQLYRVQHYYYHYNGFSLEDVEHLRLENVTVLSTPGHAFTMGGKSHHVVFDHVNIVPPKDDPKRVITCTADHFHIWQSRGFVKLENCEFSLGADDIMNMHDNTAFVRRTGPRTVRALHASVLAMARKGDRMEFRNGDYSPTGFFGTFVEAKRIPDRKNGFDVTFAEDVPEETKDGFILFNWTYDTHNVIVRNCTFHDNRARALLILARDVTVENNVFRHQEMGAIKIETGYTHRLWSEGYGVSNVVIRGNLFDTVNPSGSAALHRQRSIYTGIYLRTDPSPDTTDYPIIRDILVDGNVFRDNTGVTAYLSSVSNVVVRGNVIEDPTPRRRETPYRSQFFMTNARDVRVIDNTYRASPNVQKPGVVYDPENCAGIVIEGNRIE